MGERILLADSRFVVRPGLRSFLLHEFPHAYIEEATSPETFITLLTACPHDIIVVYQPFLKKISHPPEGNMIVLVSKSDKELFLLARTYHARAYLGSNHMEDLLHTALHLEPGEFLIDPAFYDWLAELLGENRIQSMSLEQLTIRERERLLSYEIKDCRMSRLRPHYV